MDNHLRPHHFAISVADYDETVLRYKEKLDFTLMKEAERDDLGCKIAWLGLNGIILEVFCFRNTQPLPEYRRALSSDLQTQGMKHFAFVVKDIHKKIKELQERGVIFEGVPVVGAGGQMYCFFKDNNGILLEICEEDEYIREDKKTFTKLSS